MIKIKLKELLQKQGKTMTWLHEQTGISKNTLSLMANNSSKGIQFDTLEKICINLNVTPNDLIEIQQDKWNLYSSKNPKTFDDSSVELFIVKLFTEQNKTRQMIDNERTVDISANPHKDYQIFCFVTKDSQKYTITMTTKDSSTFDFYSEETALSFSENAKFFNDLSEEDRIILINDIAEFLVERLLPFDESIKFLDLRVRMDTESDLNFYFNKQIVKTKNKIELIDSSPSFF